VVVGLLVSSISGKHGPICQGWRHSEKLVCTSELHVNIKLFGPELLCVNGGVSVVHYPISLDITLSFLFLLIPRNFCGAIVALMAAFQLLACQQQPTGTQWLGLAFTSIKRKKNWGTASLTTHAEIPPCIGLGPSRNIHLVLAGRDEGRSEPPLPVTVGTMEDNVMLLKNLRFSEATGIA
jgi:hypothetical protein